MSEQRLFAPPPADGNLTGRQKTVLALLEQHPEGLKGIDAGRELHADCRFCRSARGQHGPEATCTYASDDGKSVLEALVKRELARRRRGGVYQPVRNRPGQGDDIPY